MVIEQLSPAERGSTARWESLDIRRTHDDCVDLVILHLDML